MCSKFFHGLLQCRNRDINIAANHAFTRDFSHSRGPRQREHLDWISDVTGKWSWRVWSDFVKVYWVYLRERVWLGGLCHVLWKCIKSQCQTHHLEILSYHKKMAGLNSGDTTAIQPNLRESVSVEKMVSCLLNRAMQTYHCNLLKQARVSDLLQNRTELGMVC